MDVVEKITNLINGKGVVGGVWENDAYVKITTKGNNTYIDGNKAGLVSLACAIIEYVYGDSPKGCDIHLDAKRKNWNGYLDEKSNDVIVYLTEK